MMNLRTFLPLLGGLLLAGCYHHGQCQVPHEQRIQPPYDRPFPLGQVSDAHWDTQQTNAEAADFIFYDHEFVGNTAELTPAARKHIEQVALRMPHVPFPVVVEETENEGNRELDQRRREAIIGHLTQIGVEFPPERVVVAPAFPPGLSAIEGEAAYYSTFYDNFGTGGGIGRRFGGRGGTFR